MVVKENGILTVEQMSELGIYPEITRHGLRTKIVGTEDYAYVTDVLGILEAKMPDKLKNVTKYLKN